jgi:hypothetical protein
LAFFSLICSTNHKNEENEKIFLLAVLGYFLCTRNHKKNKTTAAKIAK